MRLRIALLALLCLSTGLSAAERRPPRIAGTYTNLALHDETGDLVGTEIKIVPVVGGRYQAAVIVSVGEVQPLRVADVQVTGQSVSFVVREDNGTSWSFRGTVSAESLKGTITHSEGGRENVTLRRHRSYWD